MHFEQALAHAREPYLLLEGIEVVRERRRYTRLVIGV